MIGHGACVVIAGLFFGFFLLWNALGAVQVWPFPALELRVPGSLSGWRAAHVGPILNGLLCMAGAFVLPVIDLPDRSERWVMWGLIYTVWANLAFYIFGILGTNRGLSVASDKFGAGNLFDVLAYVPAATAAFVTIAVIFIVARGAFARARD